MKGNQKYADKWKDERKKERKIWILMIYDCNLESLWGHCKKSNVIKHQYRFIHNK